ncbi:NADP-dependent oxidoreductase [Cucumibacter marinus]|uniref:NADP-dependent oxidoreductase n=1 Tax=Cucumibacter marinus TaxID=1121252 RepID=UPI0003F7A525|nr:NADP-dependent oxidoreductase [Cucumibacter marinus]
MKAVRLQAYGDVDQFKLEDVATPSPGEGEILIRVLASAVNHLDLFVRKGLRSSQFPMTLPAILGGDAAGIVETVGPGVNGFAAGDRVIAHFRPLGRGPHAELAVAPREGVAHLPESVDFLQGAALPQVGLTGRQIVDVIEPQGGERVLVAGAGSAVGRAALQYLQELGATPVAAVLPDEMEEFRALVGEVIDITLPPAEAAYDKAVVTVAPAIENALGHVVSGGKMGAPILRPEGQREDVEYFRIAHFDDPRTLQRVADAAGRGDLVIPIAAVFPLENLADAHKALARGARGKIVIQHSAFPPQ